MKEFIEIILLAFTIFAESSGEPDQGKIAVGCVIRNRVNYWNKSYTDIILKNKQFSCYNNFKEISKHILRLEKKTFKRCLLISKDIYYNNTKDNTNGSLYYVKKGIIRQWMEDLTITITIKNHVFMKDSDKVKGGKMKEIYRIENIDDGKGPYNTKNSNYYKFHKNLLDEHDTSSYHKSIMDDLSYDELKEKNMNRLVLCSGCKNIEQLETWFGKYFKIILKSKKFVVRKYKVKEDDYIDGTSNKQIFFRKPKKSETINKRELIC